ncbi:uncharacterized protein MELLADRAFT_85703 [Melampsora larici-populina 98AG31]|uniref:Tyr recombinase domain-containing protein n=1 Tax=Melampsora larici-populina (strain 98AG31 / pathotype 3-4-7) TaxID=747676 RepID=F4RJH4_MELLP|nr:uncharacterized protein MELLADRAFT_85703 [Melampsora larici-populina 98AG31]EGG07494.1 hypothetical protein MELLADRAFT_85703 [Melampsora larici-populina 98AG31]
MTGDKQDSSEVIRRSDVEFTKGGGIEQSFISLRGAKTAKAGETQTLQLIRLNHVLCPIAALERRLAQTTGNDDPLFSFTENGLRHVLQKQTIITACQNIWNAGGEKGLTGHSFRVGGASLRFALGIPIPEICEIGRWKAIRDKKLAK